MIKLAGCRILFNKMRSRRRICKMSDLNDDLLNDELDDEIDDQALIGADEDELLLSDEELERNVSSETKAQLKDDAEKWVDSQLATENETAPTTPPTPNKCKGVKKVEEIVVTTSSTCNDAVVSPQSTSKESDRSSHIESDVSTSEETPTKTQTKKIQRKPKALLDPPSKNDEVTSTNKEIEDQSVTQTIELNSSSGGSHIVEIDGTSEVIQSSQEGSTTATEEITSDPREDAEDRTERTNIKHTSERSDQIDSSPEKYHPNRYFPAKRGRGMGIRGGHFPGIRPPVRYPHLNYQQYPLNPNDNINNPQAPTQYFPYNPIDSTIGTRPPFPQNNPQVGPRSDYRPPPINAGFRAQNPNDFSIYRGPRPEYVNHINGTPPFNNYHPQNHIRPMFRPEGNPQMQMPQQRFDLRTRMPIPRPPGIHVQGNPPYMPSIQISVNQAHPPGPPGSGSQGGPPHPGNISIIATPAAAGQTQSVIPRKVLINPNFKGGVEAVKCQLMKDTQFMQTIGPHVSHLQSDEELLRQQEEFINKNRMHIEKRRHERSPERRRSRDRSYSPNRRDRRGDSRERRGGSRGRRRRADSRDFDLKDGAKRRRSISPGRRQDRDKLEEEDAETRAYRLEIEKQKAMREKILRDKEMRRRKAIEGKQEGDKPSSSDEPPAKLTPVVVTGRKIISLKKKTTDTGSQVKMSSSSSSSSKSITMVQMQQQQQHGQQQQQPQQQTIQRTIPTAKIIPETKRIVTDHLVKDASTGTSMAVIKPVVVKKTITVHTDISKDSILDEDDLLDEERLLADTPSPPSSPKPLKTVGVSLSDKSVSCTSTVGVGGMNTFTSSNRRVVLKSSTKDHQDSSSEMSRKGIFDRLEKKIGVNESVKRKIQRIVIKNAE